MEIQQAKVNIGILQGENSKLVDSLEVRKSLLNQNNKTATLTQNNSTTQNQTPATAVIIIHNSLFERIATRFMNNEKLTFFL